MRLDTYDKDSLIKIMLASYKESDTPTNFLRWGALATVATLTARNTYFKFLDRPEYLNLYVLLTADSGNRKSVALENCKRLMDKIGYYHFMPQRLSVTSFYHACQPVAKDIRAKMTASGVSRNLQTNLISEQISAWKNTSGKEKAVKALRRNRLSNSAGDPTGSILRAQQASMNLASQQAKGEGDESDVTEIGCWYNEFINMGDGNRSALIMMLNDMYDTHDFYPVLRDFTIHQPVVNLFAAITPAGLGATFNGTEFLNGMLPRTHIVYGAVNRNSMGGKPINPFKTVRDLGDDQLMVEHMAKIQNLKGEIIIPEDCQELMIRIYNIHRSASDARLAGFKDRSLVHLAKLSTNLALGRLSMTVEKEDVLYASSILLYTESLTPTALGDFANTPDAKAKALILKILSEESGALTHTELMGKVLSLDSSLAELTIGTAMHTLYTIKEIKKIQSVVNNTTLVQYTAVASTTDDLTKFDGVTYRRCYIPEAEW